jgi:hypothetical protein
LSRLPRASEVGNSDEPAVERCLREGSKCSSTRTSNSQLIIRALYARRYAGKIIAPATARDVVVAAQRLLYRLLAFCWALEESAAIALLMACAIRSWWPFKSSNALDGLSRAAMDSRAIPFDVPDF